MIGSNESIKLSNIHDVHRKKNAHHFYKFAAHTSKNIFFGILRVDWFQLHDALFAVCNNGVFTILHDLKVSLVEGHACNELKMKQKCKRPHPSLSALPVYPHRNILNYSCISPSQSGFFFLSFFLSCCLRTCLCHFVLLVLTLFHIFSLF